MIYRYSTLRDPRLRRASIVAGLLIAGLLSGALLALGRGATFAGGMILLGTALIAWKLRAFIRAQRQSFIQTTDEQVICRTATGDVVRIDWEHLDYTGYLTASDGSRYVYLYSESNDHFICIPGSFDSVEELCKELSSHAGRTDIEMNKDEQPADAMRRTFVEGP